MNLIKSSKNLNNLKNINTYEIIFAVLVILYIISNVSTPYNLTSTINNMFTYLSMIVVIFLMFLNKKYILAVTFAVFCLVLIYRTTQVNTVLNYPSQNNKDKKMQALNKHLDKKTLEEEIISSVSKKPDNIPNPSSYHPVLCSSHNADEF